jgi:hypothetical protein
MEEVRNKDRREMIIVCTLSVCVVVYAYLAKIIRG